MKPIKPRNSNWKGKGPPYLRNLKYGRTYFVAFAGVTDGIEFTLKKKKQIAYKWTDETVTYKSLRWLREILNRGDIHFMFEVVVKPSEHEGAVQGTRE